MIPLNDLARDPSDKSKLTEMFSRIRESGIFLNGTELSAFEENLATFLGVRRVIGVGSGTDALEIALRAVGCVQGSKVITVANAGGYTSVAAKLIGCELIYCDVDPRNLVMDLACLEELLSDEIQAVVVTHLFGNVAPAIEIRRLCDKFGIKLIEDCAQAIGAEENGRMVGSIGHIGTFSFYPTKNLGAIGDGGALSTNDFEIEQRIFELKQYGWTIKYKIDTPGGMNSRLDEIQAAVLNFRLPMLNAKNRKRRLIVSRYTDALSDSQIRMVTSTMSASAAHLAVLLLPDNLDRSKFRTYLQEQLVQTEIHYPILDTDQMGLRSCMREFVLPISQKVVSQIVTIPLFPEMLDSEVDEVCLALASFR